MARETQHFYEFLSFRIDIRKRLLLRDNEVVPLTPKCFDTLLALVQNRGEVVEKDDLMKKLWPDSFVEEGNLTYNVSILRKALGERANEHQYIVTVPGRGYRFVASVREMRDNGNRETSREGMELAVAEPEMSDGTSERGSRSQSGIQKVLDLLRRKKMWPVIPTAIALVITAAVVVRWLVTEPETSQRISVAVVDFINETNDPELNGLSGLLITSLEQSRMLSVLTRSRMFDILKQLGKADTEHIGEPLGREICNRANVEMLVIASVRKFDQLYTIDLKVVDTRGNRYVFTAKEEGESKASIPGMIDRLSERARAGLSERTDGILAANRQIADVTTTNLEAYRHYFLGEQLYSKDQTDEAAEEFGRAITLDPSFALAHYQLAYMTGWSNPDLAQEPIQKAMELIDRAPEKERYMIRAVNAFSAGRRAEAITESQEALKLYPEYKEALWMVGDLSFHGGDYATGITYFEKVLELDPQFEPGRDHLLWALRESGSHDMMLQYAKRFVEERPSEEVFLKHVEAYVVKDDFESALRASRRFLDAFPKAWLPIWAVGQTRLLENEYEKAEDEGRKLAQLFRSGSGKTEGYRLLADCYAYQGRYRDAVKMADRAIERRLKEGGEEDGHGLAFDYAMKAHWLLVGHNDVGQANAAIDEFLKLNKGSSLAYQMVFYSYLRMGEYHKASPIVNRHLGPLGPFGDLVVSGYAHRAKGDYEAAIRDFRNVAERAFSVDRIFAGYELGRCYYQIEQYEKAIDAVTKAQGIQSFGMQANHYRAAVYPRGFYLLGRIYEDKQNKKLALENYQKFLDLWKDADRDLPELIDAESRVAKLTGSLHGRR